MRIAKEADFRSLSSSFSFFVCGVERIEVVALLPGHGQRVRVLDPPPDQEWATGWVGVVEDREEELGWENRREFRRS